MAVPARLEATGQLTTGHFEWIAARRAGVPGCGSASDFRKWHNSDLPRTFGIWRFWGKADISQRLPKISHLCVHALTTPLAWPLPWFVIVLRASCVQGGIALIWGG
jgi:hypothetical protein